MTSEETSKGLSRSPEAAFEDRNVLKAIENSDWLTPEFIADVLDNEPRPEGNFKPGFKDESLDRFVESARTQSGQTLFRKVSRFIYLGLVSRSGNFAPFRYIDFIDGEFKKKALALGVDIDGLASFHNLDRGLVGYVGGVFSCVVAAKDLRRQVVRIFFEALGGTPRRDLFLLAELVKKGAKKYLQEIKNGYIDRQETIERFTEEHERLKELALSLPEMQIIEQKVVGEWTIKDIIAHLAAWNWEIIDETRRVLEDKATWPGKYEDEKGEEKFNRRQVEERKDKSFKEIIEEWDDSFKALKRLMENLSQWDWTHRSGKQKWRDGKPVTLYSLFSYEYGGQGHEGGHAKQISEFLGRRNK